MALVGLMAGVVLVVLANSLGLAMSIMPLVAGRPFCSSTLPLGVVLARLWLGMLMVVLVACPTALFVVCCWSPVLMSRTAGEEPPAGWAGSNEMGVSRAPVPSWSPPSLAAVELVWGAGVVLAVAGAAVVVVIVVGVVVVVVVVVLVVVVGAAD